MKRHVGKILIVLLFFTGFSLLVYPFVANEWNNYRQSRLMRNYQEAVAGREESGEIDYEAEWEEARAYNEALLPSILPDSFAAAEASEGDERYASCLNLGGNGVMGSVEIPKIGIVLPIFHTTKEEYLQMAAGHLEGSSLPVGGEDTHTVISAHRGLPSAALFTDLDKMEEGDHFLFHILNETLCYEIDQITVVEPEETEVLAVESGEDLATLMTCTPYGVNSHRLMVRGHRIPYEAEVVAGEKLSLANMSLHTNYLLWVVVGVVVTGMFSFVLYRKEAKRKKEAFEAVAADGGPNEEGALGEACREEEGPLKEEEVDRT